MIECGKKGCEFYLPDIGANDPRYSCYNCPDNTYRKIMKDCPVDGAPCDRTVHHCYIACAKNINRKNEVEDFIEENKYGNDGDI